MSHILLYGSGDLTGTFAENLEHRHYHGVTRALYFDQGEIARAFDNPDVDLCVVANESTELFSIVVHARVETEIEQFPMVLSRGGRTTGELLEEAAAHVGKVLRFYCPVTNKYPSMHS